MEKTAQLFEHAKERALSRSETLRNIEKNYEKSMEKASSPQPVTNNSSSSNFLAVMNQFPSSGSISKKIKLDKALEESFLKKSVMIDNTSSQAAASDSKATEKRRLSKRKGNLLSKTKLKALECHLHRRKAPPTYDTNLVLSLHEQWSTYAQRLKQASSSEAQYQSILYSMELIGAMVVILQCPRAKMVGRYGIIVAATEGLYHIALMQSDISMNSDADRISQHHQESSRMCVTRILRTTTTLGTMIPQGRSSGQRSSISTSLIPSHLTSKDKMFVMYGSVKFDVTVIRTMG